jgi:hypothetical protein
MNHHGELVYLPKELQIVVFEDDGFGSGLSLEPTTTFHPKQM